MGGIEGMGRQLGRKWRELLCPSVISEGSSLQNKDLATEVWDWDRIAGSWSYGPSFIHPSVHLLRKHLFEVFDKARTLQDAGESNVNKTQGGSLQATPGLGRTCQQTQGDECRGRGVPT